MGVWPEMQLVKKHYWCDGIRGQCTSRTWRHAGAKPPSRWWVSPLGENPEVLCPQCRKELLRDYTKERKGTSCIRAYVPAICFSNIPWSGDLFGVFTFIVHAGILAPSTSTIMGCPTMKSPVSNVRPKRPGLCVSWTKRSGRQSSGHRLPGGSTLAPFAAIVAKHVAPTPG